MNDLIDQHLGQYKILAPIGEGGMGMVYRARDMELKREVAVKVLPPDLARDREFVARFMREAETAAGLDHPNIVTIYNVGHRGGVYYLAMQLLSGRALNQILRAGERLAPARVLRIIQQLASALDYAHERGIIHRDIKPGNIMVGPHDYVTLMDFGIAKALNRSKITRTGTMIGTPEYMAPEQFTGEPVDARADVYALSIVLYEMLAGCVPFTGETPVAVSHGHVYQQPTPLRQHNSQIPSAVERVVLRGLAKRPEARYTGAGALAQALEAALQGKEVVETEHLPRSLKLILPNGLEYGLAPGRLTLGRSSENDIEMRDEKISRQHAEIRSDAHGSAIVDLNSANGTFVDGQRIAPHRPHTLRAGMTVRLGTDATLRVQSGPPAGRKTVPLELPAADEPHMPTKSTVRPGGSPPAAKSGLSGWMWGVLGVGLIGMVGLALLASGLFSPGSTSTITPERADGTEPPITIVVTATSDPGKEQPETPVVVVVTATPEPVTATPTPRPRSATDTPSAPTPTPRADLIVYACGNVGRSDICTVDSDGSAQTLISSSYDDAEPAWSSDGQQIVFHSNRAGSYDIFVSDARGRNIQNLTNTSDQDERMPDWSPSGWRFAYEVGDGVNNGEVWVIDIEENRAYFLTTGRAPAWSLEGDRVALMRKQSDGYWQIYIQDTQTGATTALSHPGEHCRFPAWSPDGEWIAYNTFVFGSQPQGATYDLWRTRADGSGGPERLTTAGDSGRPSWSPDGRRIVYNYGEYLHILEVSAGSMTKLNRTQNGWAPDWLW